MGGTRLRLYFGGWPGESVVSILKYSGVETYADFLLQMTV
jgi:hypothetical protein